MTEWKLEPEYDEIYRRWQTAPTPDNNAEILQALSTDIDKAIRAQVGRPNPLLRSRGRQVALQSLQTYDPSRSRLRTHLYNHMQGLKRYSGQQARAVQIPERLLLDRYQLDLATQELFDQYGRDPTDDELSDYTGFSGRRLARLRRYSPEVTAGGLQARTQPDFSPAVSQAENQAWLQLIHDDLSPVDQKIFEWSIGFNGAPVLSNQEIASRLNRSPSAVTQRKRMIQRMIDEEADLSPF